MTKTSIALTELTEKGPDVDLVRDMLHLAFQRLTEMDVEELCRARYGERDAKRQNARNGYRDRRWETRCATVDLRIPKLRKGSDFSRIPRAAAHRRESANGGHPGSVRARPLNALGGRARAGDGHAGRIEEPGLPLGRRDRGARQCVLEPPDRGRLAGTQGALFPSS